MVLKTKKQKGWLTMGLDMYLYAKRFIWSDESKEITKKINEIIKCPFENEGVKEISVGIMYWRKANAIHNWFVEHVQDGKDDCGSYFVSKENLIELKNVCEEVLKVAIVEYGKVYVGTTWDKNGETKNYKDGIVIANPEMVAEILPSSSGCFFGSTDYDEYYLNDVKQTFNKIQKILSVDEKEFNSWGFEYMSSW